MADDQTRTSTLPRWTGLAVFVFVIVAIAAVLLAMLVIPSAKRPSILPAPRTTVITRIITHTPTP